MNTSPEISADELEKIKLRKIASLDGSELFQDNKEKEAQTKLRAPRVVIPEYPPTPPYKTNALKRFYARVRYFAALMKQRASGKDYPVIAIIVVNNKCNWNCTYCFGDYPNRREKDYTTNELKYLVDQLYALGVRYINVHGGEALLRQDIGEVCSYIKCKGMYLCVITNGSLLPKKLDAILCADNVTISLDGAKEGNDQNRGEGTFDVTLNAIRIVQEAKIPLRVQATLSKHTMKDVGYLAKLAYDSNFHLQFSILFKPLKKAKDAQMTNEEIKQTLAQIQHYKDLGYPVFTSDQSLRAAYEWPYDYNDRHHVTDSEVPKMYRKYHIPCYYSRTKFTIEADGYVYPCFLTTDGSFIPKNWREAGVINAIEHVQNKNTCRACPAMTQNDHNLLLGLNFKQVLYIIGDQVKETFLVRNKLKNDAK